MNNHARKTLTASFTCAPSEAARRRLQSRRDEPLFVAGWQRVLMIHFEVEAAALQRDVPYSLDLREGRAFVSAVAFTMHGLRPRRGGKLVAGHDGTESNKPSCETMGKWMMKVVPLPTSLSNMTRPPCRFTTAP